MKPGSFSSARWRLALLVSSIDQAMECLELTEIAPRNSWVCATFDRSGEDLIKFQSQYASKKSKLLLGVVASSKLLTAGFNPQALKIYSDRGCAFVREITRHPRHFLIFLGQYKKNTSGSYSSLKCRIWLKIGQGILHTRRYTNLSFDLGSGTDVQSTYVSVGVKMHVYYAISKHRYELAGRLSR